MSALSNDQVVHQLYSTCEHAQQSAIRHCLHTFQLSDERRVAINHVFQQGPPWPNELVELLSLMPCAEFAGGVLAVLQHGTVSQQHLVVYNLQVWEAFIKSSSDSHLWEQALRSFTYSSSYTLAFDSALQYTRFFHDTEDIWNSAAEAVIQSDSLNNLDSELGISSNLRESCALLPQGEIDRLNMALQRHNAAMISF